MTCPGSETAAGERQPVRGRMDTEVGDWGIAETG